MTHHNSDYDVGEPACQAPAPKPTTEGVTRVHRPVCSARNRLPRACHREARSPPEDARVGRPLRYPVVALPADRRRRAPCRRWCPRRTEMGSNRDRGRVRNVRAARRRADDPPAIRRSSPSKRRPHSSPSPPASPTSPWPSTANEPLWRSPKGRVGGRSPTRASRETHAHHCRLHAGRRAAGVIDVTVLSGQP